MEKMKVAKNHRFLNFHSQNEKSKKMKVIKIAHCSHSYFLGEGEKELKKLVLNDWYAKFSKQIKKFYNEIEVECWAPEKIYKKKQPYCQQKYGYDNIGCG